MHRSQIINHLIKQRGYKRYLEIGTALDETFPYIDAPSRVGVDPDPRTSASFHMMSDEFFQKVAPYCAPFDIIFIDADKENYPVYLDMALKLSKPGTVILSDNVIPRGVEMHGQTQIDAVNIYKFNDKIASHPNLDSTIIHTIVNDLEFGRIDGLAICLVK